MARARFGSARPVVALAALSLAALPGAAGPAASASLHSGDLIVANVRWASERLDRIDAGTGAITTPASGGLLVSPFDLCVASDGAVLVVDADQRRGACGWHHRRAGRFPGRRAAGRSPAARHRVRAIGIAPRHRLVERRVPPRRRVPGLRRRCLDAQLGRLPAKPHRYRAGNGRRSLPGRAERAPRLVCGPGSRERRPDRPGHRGAEAALRLDTVSGPELHRHPPGRLARGGPVWGDAGWVRRRDPEARSGDGNGDHWSAGAPARDWRRARVATCSTTRIW